MYVYVVKCLLSCVLGEPFVMHAPKGCRPACSFQQLSVHVSRDDLSCTSWSLLVLMY